MAKQKRHRMATKKRSRRLNRTRCQLGGVELSEIKKMIKTPHGLLQAIDMLNQRIDENNAENKDNPEKEKTYLMAKEVFDKKLFDLKAIIQWSQLIVETPVTPGEHSPPDDTEIKKRINNVYHFIMYWIKERLRKYKIHKNNSGWFSKKNEKKDKLVESTAIRNQFLTFLYHYLNTNPAQTRQYNDIFAQNEEFIQTYAGNLPGADF